MGDSLQRGCHNIYAPTIVRNVPRFDSRSRTIALYARQLHGHAANKLTRGGLKDPADLGRVGGYGARNRRRIGALRASRIIVSPSERSVRDDG